MLAIAVPIQEGLHQCLEHACRQLADRKVTTPQYITLHSDNHISFARPRVLVIIYFISRAGTGGYTIAFGAATTYSAATPLTVSLQGTSTFKDIRGSSSVAFSIVSLRIRPNTYDSILLYLLHCHLLFSGVQCHRDRIRYVGCFVGLRSCLHQLRKPQPRRKVPM